MKLESDKLVMRTIAPSTTILNADHSAMIFADIRGICVEGDTTLPILSTKAPYSARSMPEYLLIPAADAFWDQWSVGMLILEVLVGTEAVMATETCSDVQGLVEAAADYIDPATRALLGYLLLDGPSVDLADYVTRSLDASSMCITETIRGLRAALRLDAKLRKTATLGR